MLTISKAVNQAKKAGACAEALDAIILFNRKANVMSLYDHPKVIGWAYWYARNVIKGRWLEAEPVISKAAEWAYQYARNVIKGRWLEAEPVISKDSEWAYRYACNVIKQGEAKC